MNRRFLSRALAMKLALSLLFFSGCSHDSALQAEKGVVLTQEMPRDWDSASNCVLKHLNDNVNFGALGLPSSNALAPDFEKKKADIAIRRLSDMNLLFNVEIKETKPGQSVATVRERFSQPDAYTDTIMTAIRNGVDACGRN